MRGQFLGQFVSLLVRGQMLLRRWQITLELADVSVVANALVADLEALIEGFAQFRDVEPRKLIRVFFTGALQMLAYYFMS